MAWKPQGSFQHHWFANLTAGLWSRFVLPRFEKHAGPINYLETGVADGMSMLYALEHFGRPGGLFVGVDPFWNSRGWHEGEGLAHEQRAVANLSKYFDYAEVERSQDNNYYFLPDKRTGESNCYDCELRCQSSLEYLPFESRKFDICYVDANHEAPAALTDMINCWRILKLGGLMIVDDAERRYRGGMPAVAVALDGFENCFHGYFDVVFRHPKQVCYVKVSKRRRGQYPPTMVAIEPIAPTGETGDSI